MKLPLPKSFLLLALLVAFAVAGCGGDSTADDPSASAEAASSQPGSSAPGASEPAASASLAPLINVEDAFAEMETIASFFDCEITEGARPNSLVCLLRDDGFFAAVIHHDDGRLDQILIASVSRDRWATELPHLEMLLERYARIDAESIRNVYPGLYDPNPTLRSATEMSLNTLLNTFRRSEDPTVSITPDTEEPWIAFTFEFH